MVLGRINGVYTDGVGLDLREVLNVALARCSVRERIRDFDAVGIGLCGVGVDFLCFV